MQDSIFGISGVVQRARVFEERLEVGLAQFYLAETSLARGKSPPLSQAFTHPTVTALRNISHEDLYEN